MRSILLLPLVARCLETIDVCIWRMFVFMYVVVTVWGSWTLFKTVSLKKTVKIGYQNRLPYLTAALRKIY